MSRRSNYWPAWLALAAGAATFALNTDGLSSDETRGVFDSFARDSHAAAPSAPVYYSHCADARRAGVAPIYRGEPGYRPELDADDDGIACEPYYGR